MRYALIVLSSLLLLPLTSTRAEVSIGFNAPGISIGINMPAYPNLIPVPGYPVYYDPRVNANYFFYDGLYWVFYTDNWYASSWYNGPWHLVGPDEVPLFILRIPVRYYRRPPAYFRGWRADAPPRWGEHWGHEWERHHRDWDRWNRRATPAPAPLPRYQRKYSGRRYPGAVEQQRILRSRNYRYQPREPVSRQYYRGTRKNQDRMNNEERKKGRNDSRNYRDQPQRPASRQHYGGTRKNQGPMNNEERKKRRNDRDQYGR